MDNNINEYRFNDDDTDYRLRHDVMSKADYIRMLANKELNNNK